MSEPKLPETRSASPQTSLRPQDDPLAGLFRMSRTAGLGSTEYVAINALAVVALVLGIASFFVRLGLPLLILPLAGVLTGIAAVRQIRHSSGTQKGTVLAVLGLALSIGFGGWAGVQQVSLKREEARDRVAIAQVIREMGDRFKAKDLQTVYAELGEAFRGRIDFATFTQTLVFVAGSDRAGKLQTVTPGEIVFFDRDRASGLTEATTSAAFKYEVRAEENQIVVKLQKPSRDGQWVVSDLPTMFPEERPAQ